MSFIVLLIHFDESQDIHACETYFSNLFSDKLLQSVTFVVCYLNIVFFFFFFY